MARASDDGKLSAIELSQLALVTVQELTGYQPEAVTGLRWNDEYWEVTVDVLELARIPNTTDLLASYVVQLDSDGGLRGYERVSRFQRGHSREGE